MDTIFTAAANAPRPINSIVRGIKCGVFVILGSRSIGGEAGYQLKAVNPANLSETAPGELWLPATAVVDY